MLKIIPQPVAVTLADDHFREDLVFQNEQAKTVFITLVDVYAEHNKITKADKRVFKVTAIKTLRTLYDYLTRPEETRLSLICAKRLIEQGWPIE